MRYISAIKQDVNIVINTIVNCECGGVFNKVSNMLKAVSTA
jgi:hypothetical protein